MAPTLNQDDIKLLKGIFATKDDFYSIKNDVISIKKDLRKTEAKLLRRMDYVDKTSD